MKFTAEQAHAIECFRSSCDLKINAFAGAGKTTTLNLLSRSRTGNGLYIAFNKSIASEASEKFPSSVSCKTTHGLAYTDVASAYGYTNAKMVGNFSSAQIAEVFKVPELTIGNTRLTSLNRATVAKRVVTNFCESSANSFLLRHVPIEGRLMGLTAPQKELFQMTTLQLAKKIWESMVSREGQIPLGHNGYLKVWALRDPDISTDYILLDEAQDSNAVVLGVLKRQSCQVVYVGDKHQQIYQWRGAVNAMESVENCIEAYLTQSFRFGDVIADAASNVLTVLGEHKRIKGNPDIISRIGAIRDPRAFLARKNATVVQKVLECLEDGRAVSVLGGTTEIVRQLNDVVSLKRGIPGISPEFFGFQNWREVEDFSETEDGEDIRRFVKLVAQYGEDRLLWAMKRTEHSEAEADLVVSTVHKAKGREWDSVQLANDFWMSRPDDDDEPLPEEEIRLFYVAITRAKHLLDVPPELLQMYC